MTHPSRIRAAILRWYRDEHRDFPWRGTRDPWAVLVSEVMLQQTQAARIVERYPPFLRRFPTPAAMAAAPEREVLVAWSGLGYNRRALALRRAAAAVERDGWPQDVAGLETLPGVGPYTARAVAGLALGAPVGVVDTNVRRWLVRRFGLPSAAAPRELQARADALAAGARDAADAAAWIHASMEFGAAICRSRDPRCDSCPVSRGCPSRGRAAQVPVPRQPAFAGSSRAARGAILRRLVAAPGHAAPEPVLGADLAAGERRRIIAGLERDGLVHRAGGRVLLGPAPARPTPAGPAPAGPAGPEATIGP